MPGDRCGDGRVLELHLRVLQRRLVGIHGGVERRDRRLRGIDLLARRDASLRQLFEPFGLLRRVGGLSEIAIEVGLRLLQRRSSGRRSSVKRTWPAVTSSPSVKLTLVNWPVVWARIATLDIGSAEPMTLISIGIDFGRRFRPRRARRRSAAPTAPSVSRGAGRRGALFARTTGDDDFDQRKEDDDKGSHDAHESVQVCSDSSRTRRNGVGVDPDFGYSMKAAQGTSTDRRGPTRSRERDRTVTGLTRCTSKPAADVRCRSCCCPQPVSATSVAPCPTTSRLIWRAVS